MWAEMILAISMALHNVDDSQSEIDDALLLMEQNGEWSSMNYEFIAMTDNSNLHHSWTHCTDSVNWNDDCTDYAS